MIPFNKPPLTGNEINYIQKAFDNGKICGDGEFTKKCNSFFEHQTGSCRVLLTTSGSSSLDMAARLLDLKAGDEVIMPSFTFTSTANAFVQVGATICFVDIDPKTMNISPLQIEKAINSKTKVIVPVHYAGVSCDMDEILAIAKKHHLIVVEDAAQGVNAFYKNKALGTMGLFGCFSFHETKNYSMGEGGALLINSPAYIEKAEILREKGTNRSKFLRGQVDKYSWVAYGSSYLPSDINAAYLYSQLEKFELINKNRLDTWNRYFNSLKPLADNGFIELPFVPSFCKHNAHMFYIKVKNIDERTDLISYLKKQGISASFHYVPLHSSPAGQKYGYFYGEDIFTTKESNRLLRLPLFYNISPNEVDEVISAIYGFFKEKEGK